MTRSDRTFPVGPRLLALGAAIVALLVSVPMAGASTSAPSKNQVQSAHQAYLAAEGQIRQYRSQIESIQVQLNAAVDKLDRLQAQLAQIQAQVAETKARIADAQARYDEIRSRLEERAAQAFIAGPASDLEIFLGATSMDDLSDRMQFVDAVTQADATLALAANLNNGQKAARGLRTRDLFGATGRDSCFIGTNAGLKLAPLGGYFCGSHRW